MTQKFIVDPLTVRGLQTEVDKNLWSAYEKQNPAYIQCLVGFHKMSLKDRMKFFGIKSIELIKTSYLTELYHEEEIFVEECGGDIESGLSSAGNLFTGYLSSNLKDWKLINPQRQTERTQVKVFEMCKDADYSTLFNSFNIDLEKLCMTQAQIKNFCERHKDKLRKDGYGTFFLFKEKVDGEEKFFVACVSFDDVGRLELGVCRFRIGGVWSASYRHRIVVPATVLM